MVEHLKGGGARPSELQLEIIKEVCEQSYRDNKNIRSRMEGNNVEYGDYMTFCQADMLAVAYNESRFDCSAVNHNGEDSHGCHQIHLGVHRHVTEEQAHNYRWSAAWTFNRLVLNGWRPRTINGQANRYSIMRHNGAGDRAWNYALNAVRMSNLFIEEYNL